MPPPKHPTLIWAYPLEYTQASDAGQVRAAPNRYLRLAGSSHLFLLLHGYAVFDDAAMPIVGPVRTANDTFVLQVQQNARAAVKALVAEGVVDEKRIAVRAACTLGLGIAGVDLLRSNRGPLMLEVNASPGLEGIEAATGVNVSGHIIQHLEQHAGK